MHRFPPLVEQTHPDQTRREQTRIIAKSVPLPSLPWAEMSAMALVLLVLALS